MNPAVEKSTRVVVGKGRGLAGSARQRPGQQVGFDQNLKSVADPDNRLARANKFPQSVAKVVHELISEDFASRDVVAVTEAARKGQYLAFPQNAGGFQDSIDVHGADGRPCELKSMGGFDVAVGAGSPEDKRCWFHVNSGPSVPIFIAFTRDEE
jgi:hypothetical protein